MVKALAGREGEACGEGELFDTGGKRCDSLSQESWPHATTAHRPGCIHAAVVTAESMS